MNKKGFTLIEILAIIILLSVIALITYPIINNLITDSKDELYDKQISELVRLSNTWVTKNITKLKMIDGYTYNLSFDELYEQGFVSDEQVKNPKTGQNLPGCMKVTFNSTNNGYDVSYDERCTSSGEVALYEDNSGANKPVLFNNMKPIKYENNKWIVANLYSKWYDYDAKEWANAVVLNSGVTKNVGDEVTEEEISLWYVLVPRYKYKKFSNTPKEQEISVTFENGTSTTGTGENVTHPAFTFGNTELTGFWVGKFEVSGTTSAITIKPNVTSSRSQTLSSFFTAIQNVKTIYGINNADSHMLKNMEWGAVAYLKQSKYGLGTTDIAVNKNSNFYTGGGQSDAYKTNVAQSTTGNIYGVYDMSGGAWEYVMGNYNDTISKAGFSSMPAAKYYDKYTSSTGKTGDAITETSGWYGDHAEFPDSTDSWFVRGGSYNFGTNAGVFYFSITNGVSFGFSSARAVLSSQ